MKKFLLAISLLLASSPAFAIDPIFTPLFSDQAIRGYDTVAYFTENKAVKGIKEHVYEYKGVKWLVASAENKELFIANPEKYEPQYGGYCAYAVSKGGTASVEPDQFTVHNGKLYLNYNASINEKWLQDKDGFIAKADQNWPDILAEEE